MFKVFKTEKDNFALYGFLFGSLFPLFGTLIQTLLEFNNVTVSNIIYVQQTFPLLWIIDSAPFWLSLWAMFGGIQLDKINAYNESLEHEVEEKELELKEEHEREKLLIIEKADAFLEIEDSKMKMEELEKELVN